MRQDDRGEEVIKLQEALNLRGANLVVDGFYGPKTAYAVGIVRRAFINAGGLDAVHVQDMLRYLYPGNEIAFRDHGMLVLNVPYLSQRDNQYKSSSTCNVTSVAMCLAYLGVPIILPDHDYIQLEDGLFTFVQSQWGADTAKRVAPWAVGKYYTIHAVLAELLKHWHNKYPTYKTTKCVEITPDVVHNSIENLNMPVITSTGFTNSGHIVVITGITTDDDLIIHDPWGDWLSGYKSINGKNRFIPSELVWEAMERNGHIYGITME
jgi:hypothetical protein